MIINKKYLLPIFAIITISFFSSCSTTAPRVLNYSPDSDQVDRWVAGKPVMEAYQDGIQVSVLFYRFNSPYIEFDVVVTNMRDKSILVSPKDFYLNPSISETTFNTRAINTEARIRGFDRQIEKRKSDRGKKEAIDTGFAFLGMIVDVATIGESKTKEEIKEEKENDRYREEQKRRDEKDYFRDIERMESERSYWENSMLRKTTLGPNQTATGKVLFNAPYKRTNLELILPINGIEFRFPFIQH